MSGLTEWNLGNVYVENGEPIAVVMSAPEPATGTGRPGAGATLVQWTPAPRRFARPAASTQESPRGKAVEVPTRSASRVACSSATKTHWRTVSESTPSTTGGGPAGSLMEPLGLGAAGSPRRAGIRRSRSGTSSVSRKCRPRAGWPRSLAELNQRLETRRVASSNGVQAGRDRVRRQSEDRGG